MSKKKKMPSIFTMAKNFAKDLSLYIKEGAPNVTNKQYTERLKACNTCPNLNKKQMRCTLCGCLIEHKAKWKTTTCPDTPPRWKAVYRKPGTPATERERNAKNINKILRMGAEDKMWDPQNPETLDPFLKGIGIKGGTVIIDEKGNTENREEKEENKDKD